MTSADALSPGAGRCGPRGDPVDQLDHALNLGPLEVLGDEDDLAAPVGIRPPVKPGEIVQEMLGALNDRRPVGFLGDMDDALHTQQIGAEILLDRIEQQPQRLLREWAVPG